MAKSAFNGKRALIDKANSTVVLVAGVAAFIVVFSLVASKTLVSQMAYQNRVLSEKHKALQQIKQDQQAAGKLDTAYKAFTSTAQNVLNGNPTGSGAQDGDNAKIVLDALPSTYDFPALITSVEKLINIKGVTITSIGGTDDEIAQGQSNSSPTPQPIEVPFSVSVSGDYASIQAVVAQFEHSIRPMQVQTVTLSGDQSKLTMDLTVKTYYQPAKSLNIGKKVVK